MGCHQTSLRVVSGRRLWSSTGSSSLNVPFSWQGHSALTTGWPSFADQHLLGSSQGDFHLRCLLPGSTLGSAHLTPHHPLGQLRTLQNHLPGPCLGAQVSKEGVVRGLTQTFPAKPTTLPAGLSLAILCSWLLFGDCHLPQSQAGCSGHKGPLLPNPQAYPWYSLPTPSSTEFQHRDE